MKELTNSVMGPKIKRWPARLMNRFNFNAPLTGAGNNEKAISLSNLGQIKNLSIQAT